MRARPCSSCVAPRWLEVRHHTPYDVLSGETLELDHAEPLQPGVVPEPLAHLFGHQRLAAVCESRHPRRLRDIAAEVVAVAQHRGARVDADPHLHRRTTKVPAARADLALHPGGCGHRVLR